MKRHNDTKPCITGVHTKESGSALIIALFVLALVSVFTLYALSRTATEATSVGNEATEGRTFYAAQGSLETMTRNFNKVFEVRLNPLGTDIDSIRNAPVPGLSLPTGNFQFEQEVDQTSISDTAVLSGGPFSGLYAIRDTWRLRSTATDASGTQVQLTRNILNNRIPIFQFGVFYDDDLELFRPPLFSFGGRVHSNRHFFISPGPEGVYFDSRVTAAGHIITESWRNGYDDDNYEGTWIKNASGVNKQLKRDEGSVRNGYPNIFASEPDLPASRLNPAWRTQSAKFDGNLMSEVKPLKLPMNVGSGVPLIEMIKRPKNSTSGATDLWDNNGTLEPVTALTADDTITRSERFANKTGLRISLSDSKAKLPGCASGAGTAPVAGSCGIRLDGDHTGTGADPNPSHSNAALRSRGYIPKAMKLGSSDAGYNYASTRVNGERLYTGGSREVWIKIETVQTDNTDGSIVTKDITADILSLGVTEEPHYAMGIPGYAGSGCSSAQNGSPTSPSFNISATNPQSASTCPDSRSIVKIQRFHIAGTEIDPRTSAISHNDPSGSANDFNYVGRFRNANQSEINNYCQSGCDTADVGPGNERFGHLKLALSNRAVVPFPIKLFDTREGLYYDQKSTTYYSNSNFDSFRKVPRNGVMSMIDIDVANLRRFLRGDFNGFFPTDTAFALANGGSLTNDDVPENSGWVLYFSDRRGDVDFDGEFDMEDVYGSAPGNDGFLQPGEDTDPPGTHGFGVLDSKVCAFTATCEAERYRDNAVYADEAATIDHKYFRRGVRLINGTTLPGIYDASIPANTRGFTVASENGLYVLGNYNATHVTSVPSSGNTPFNNYRPMDTALHIPASIVADAVTILSNSWQDAKSFAYPWNKDNSNERQATDTTIRFAMISGDTIASREANPNQGGISPRLNGGVHNFKRFLEDWGQGSRNLNYSGSLINLFNSQNNNGSFKCCNTVYDPPRRNWVFDSTFLDPTRLPPGTPYFQYVQTTGFLRTND